MLSNFTPQYCGRLVV